MIRVIFFVYGVIAYVGFLLTFLYAIGFLANVGVPKSIDSGVEGSVGTAVIINTLLLLAFSIHHSVTARIGFKRWWTKIIAAPIERTTYVMIANLFFALIFWQWQPMTAAVWTVQSPAAQGVIWAVFALGWVLVVFSSFLIDHFDLFGLRQVYFHLRGREYSHPPYMERSLYKWIRHPLLLGWLIAFWATPSMTAGHLLISIGTTVYIVVGLLLEERTLRGILGEPYERYCQRTARFLPFRFRRRS